jgi:integrase
MARVRKSKHAKLGMLYRRNGVWYIRFSVNGQEYRESSRSTDENVARAFLEKRRNEVVEGKMVGPRRRPVSFEDLVKLIEQDYETNGRKSAASVRYRLAHLRKRFGTVPAAEITHRAIKEYVSKRLGEGAKPATVRYEIVVLGRMFKLAVADELLSNAPPLPTVKVRNARQGYFEPDEIARVLKHLPEDIAPAIEFAYYTGWRIGEIRKLTWFEHLDVEGGVVRLLPGETKNGEGRTFPFKDHKALRALIVKQAQRLMKHKTRWLFGLADGFPLGTFRKSWARACKAAGCQGRLVHDLRRTAVRNLVRAGVTERVAMQLTGHRTRSIFDRYDIVNEHDLAEAVLKLDKRRSGS